MWQEGIFGLVFNWITKSENKWRPTLLLNVGIWPVVQINYVWSTLLQNVARNGYNWYHTYYWRWTRPNESLSQKMVHFSSFLSPRSSSGKCFLYIFKRFCIKFESQIVTASASGIKNSNIERQRTNRISKIFNK